MARRSRRVSNNAGSTISLAAAMLCVASAVSAAQQPTCLCSRLRQLCSRLRQRVFNLELKNAIARIFHPK
jgi:hypothetical protein